MCSGKAMIQHLSECLVGREGGNLAHWGLGASAEEVKEPT